MLPATIIELFALAIASLSLGVGATRKPFALVHPPPENRAARRPLTLPVEFQPNEHRKPFTAPPVITGRPVINDDVLAADRPVIQETTLTTSVLRAMK